MWYFGDCSSLLLEASSLWRQDVSSLPETKELLELNLKLLSISYF